ncbi:hypothetical protein AB0H28_28860 [Micromonospora sp. NPDC050980]|uniref:hypothetical protein n=1 Tax=Micromonospora sp. NPDC050980 TaxID=3155161 RepID=UPI0033DFCB6C
MRTALANQTQAPEGGVSPADTPASGHTATTPTVVDLWYRAETGCLLGEPARYLPRPDALRASIARDVGWDDIRADTTISHLYAALRLADLVANSDACATTWWTPR